MQSNTQISQAYILGGRRCRLRALIVYASQASIFIVFIAIYQNLLYSFFQHLLTYFFKNLTLIKASNN